MFGTIIAIGAATIGGNAIAIYNAKNSTTWGGVWWKGFIVSLCFAGFGAVTHSMPRCLQYDDPGPYGSCIEYDTEGPVGTAEEKAQRILFNTAVGGSIGMALLARKLKKEGITINEYI